MQGSDALNTVPTELRGTQTRTTNEWIMTVFVQLPHCRSWNTIWNQQRAAEVRVAELVRYGAACVPYS